MTPHTCHSPFCEECRTGTLEDRQAYDAHNLTAERHATICAEVQALLDRGIPLSFALSTVQRLENQAARGMDMAYGPVTNVERVWELRA